MILHILYCLISLFYIKPQRRAGRTNHHCIVLYLSSTSNHNMTFLMEHERLIVLYLSSTSNHNLVGFPPLGCCIVLYLSSTSNHNVFLQHRVEIQLSYISLLHQTTTRASISSFVGLLSYISLLHQTTTPSVSSPPVPDCLISLFYIKPQQILILYLVSAVYIKCYVYEVVLL